MGKENVDILAAGLSFRRKETICEQLIKLVKCIQSVSEIVSFEGLVKEYLGVRWAGAQRGLVISF